MRKILLLALCLSGLLLSERGLAQSSNTETSQAEVRALVRHSIVHWLDPILPSAQVGVDYRVAPRIYLRHELGYFFDLGYEEPEALMGIDGFRLRTAYRSYFQDFTRTENAFYLEFNVDYRYLDLLIAGDFWRDNFNFQQRINYSVWQHSVTANVQVGLTSPISEHWRIDFGIGAGIRFNYRVYSGVPDDASYNTNGAFLGWDYNSRAGASFGLNVPIVIAVGYQW